MEKENEGKLAVFDFDGTLFFTDAALIKACVRVTGKTMTKAEIRALPREFKSPIYDAANIDIGLFVPNRPLIDKLNAMHEAGCRIVILTARHKTCEAGTLEALRRERVQYDQVYHDPAFVQMPDEEFKAQALKEILRGYKNAEIYEDKMENIDYLRERLGAVQRYYLVQGERLSRA